MFITFFVIPVFFSPVITIDPITDRNLDANNRLILTGTTTLPARSFIIIKVDPASPGQVQKTVSGSPLAQGYVQVIPVAGKNLWKGVVDLSSLQPAEYTMTIASFDLGEDYTRIESAPLVSRQFTLGDEKSGPASIRKRTVMEQSFIRINEPDENPLAASGKITGITSIVPGASLEWHIDNSTQGGAGVSTEGVTEVTRGTEGINRWSFMPGLPQSPGGRFRVTVAGKTGSATDEISGTAEFRLNTTGTANNSGTKGDSEGFITIDSLPDIRQNGVYIITGTTSLPAGDELLFMVLPYTSGTEIDLMIDPVTKAQVSRNPYSGQNGMIQVMQGDTTTNFWAFQLETYMMEPGTFVIKMDNDRYDLKTGNLVFRGLNASRVFTLGEQVS
jgi:hypothetical protein